MTESQQPVKSLAASLSLDIYWQGEPGNTTACWQPLLVCFHTSWSSNYIKKYFFMYTTVNVAKFYNMFQSLSYLFCVQTHLAYILLILNHFSFHFSTITFVNISLIQLQFHKFLYSRTNFSFI